MKTYLEAIKIFNIEGAVESIAPFGLGHINDSYVVKIGQKDFLLQRLNTTVFPKPQVVEQNLSKILSLAPELFPSYIKGMNGDYHQSDGQNYWRLQSFVDDSYSATKLTMKELSEVAKGYGKLTAIFHAEELTAYEEAIPSFHNLHHRLAQFQEALNRNSANRKRSAFTEISAILEFSWIASQFDELVKKGLPKRLCHNDAKFGNSLLSKQSSQFLKVVDLDTVGPGYVLFDVGDMLRSMLFNIPENQSHLDGISFDKSRFHTILDSHLSECKEQLNEVELKSLAFGGLYMTYIMAVRFLTDYLNGDIYYKIGFPNENLIRTRNQLRILVLMTEAF